jgi:DNA polymerase III subunit delta
VSSQKKASSYKIPNSRQILPSIEKGDIKTCYLFLGEEEGEKEKFIEKIASLYFGKEKPSLSRFHCVSGDIVNAASFTLESSMFSSKKMAVISEIETLISQKDTSLLADIVRDLPTDSMVILTTHDNTIPKSLSALSERLQPVIFWRMFENEIQTHILKRISSAGRTIDNQAALRIISLTGRDLRKTDEAIDRILGGTEGSITEQIVLSLIADQRDVSAFEFVESFFKRRKNCLSLLKKVLDEGGNELGLLALLQREAERIENYHAFRSAGKNHDDAIAELKINPRTINDFSESVASTDSKKIRDLFTALAAADRAIKSSKVSHSVLSSPLAEVIAAFCKKA